MPGNERTFKAEVGGVCPFCQRKFSAGHDDDGNPGLIHTLPTCKQFDELEPDEYLRAVRLKYSS